MIHKHSKKKISIVTILLSAFLLLVSSTVVQAAVNPLAKMPTKSSGVANTAIAGRTGWDYSTPQYSSKVKIQVKSYNPKVATVKGYTTQHMLTKKYYAGYEVSCVSAGTTKIKVTVTVNSKSYTKFCTYTVYKWENPLKTLKIDSKNYLSIFNKNGSYISKSDISGKTFTFKINPNFTLVSATCQSKNILYPTELKPGKNILPANTYDVYILVKSKKNNHFYTTKIHIPKNYPY